jgi:hypothetical protein
MDDENRKADSDEEPGKRLVHNHASVALSGDKDKPPMACEFEGQASVALSGDKDQPPLAHQFQGHVSHSTPPKQPLVHRFAS